MGSILDELLGEKERAAEEVTIITKADVRMRLARAEAALHAARRTAAITNDKADLVVAEAELASAREEARPHTRVFRFEAVAPEILNGLRVAHPPTKEQKAEFKAEQAKQGTLPKDMRSLAWNTDTYLPALCALCCVDPEMPEEDWVALFASGVYSDGELADLIQAAQTCNGRGGKVDLGEA